MPADLLTCFIGQNVFQPRRSGSFTRTRAVTTHRSQRSTRVTLQGIKLNENQGSGLISFKTSGAEIRAGHLIRRAARHLYILNQT